MLQLLAVLMLLGLGVSTGAAVGSPAPASSAAVLLAMASVLEVAIGNQMTVLPLQQTLLGTRLEGGLRYLALALLLGATRWLPGWGALLLFLPMGGLAMGVMAQLLGLPVALPVQIGLFVAAALLLPPALVQPAPLTLQAQ